jgi:hypothetical protein
VASHRTSIQQTKRFARLMKAERIPHGSTSHAPLVAAT